MYRVHDVKSGFLLFRTKSKKYIEETFSSIYQIPQKSSECCISWRTGKNQI
jgi:hypothetical protein